MTPTSIPSPQFVTKPWQCHGTLSSAGCMPPLSSNLIPRQERLLRLRRPTWRTRMAGVARGLPFRETDGHCCLPLVRCEVVPPPGLEDVQPQHVPREGQVLKPVPHRVPDGVVDGVPICEAEVGPLHGVFPRVSCSYNSRSGSASSLVFALVAHPQAGVVAIDAQASLPSMRRHLCRLCCRRGGVVALVTMASLPLPVRRHLAIVELASPPSSLIIELASLLLMCRHLCRRCNCDCRPHHDGVVTVVDAQASLLLLSWCVIALVTVASSPLILIRDGIVAILKLAWFSG